MPASHTSREVSTRIRVELARSGRQRKAFAVGTGIKESTLTRRFANETEWTADEVIRAAEFLGVHVMVLMAPELTTEEPAS